MRVRTAILVGAMLVLSEPAWAYATGVSVGRYSLQSSPGRAEIGGSVKVSSPSAGGVAPTPPVSGTSSPAPTGGGSSFTLPTLRRSSPLLRDSTPAGPDTLWYDGGPGQSCIYIPDSTPRCFNLTSPRAPAGQIRIDPAELAAEAASRLALTPGRIVVTPLRPRGGTTGVPSWFWLEPGPTTQQTSASAGPETVTVTAVPSAAWRYGDDVDTSGARGHEYRPAHVPDTATAHTYETRCLPGDRGNNPHVLSTCGDRGYQVEADVVWTISYVATGPVPASGSLPTRTTTASRPYSVSEVRAFLKGGT